MPTNFTLKDIPAEIIGFIQNGRVFKPPQPIQPPPQIDWRRSLKTVSEAITPQSPEEAKRMGLVPIKSPFTGKTGYIDPFFVGALKEVGGEAVKKAAGKIGEKIAARAEPLAQEVKTFVRANTSRLTEAEQIKAVELGLKPIATEVSGVKTNLPFIESPVGKIYYGEGQKETAQKAARLFKDKRFLSLQAAEQDRELGRLLGYTEKEIDDFIAGIRPEKLYLSQLTKQAGVKPLAQEAGRIPKELEPLAEEARKYKSAEEFAYYNFTPAFDPERALKINKETIEEYEKVIKANKDILATAHKETLGGGSATGKVERAIAKYSKILNEALAHKEKIEKEIALRKALNLPEAGSIRGSQLTDFYNLAKQAKGQPK